MTKIRVSNDRFGQSLLGALSRSKEGDVLTVREGEYTVDSVNLVNLRIVGVGDPNKIIIRGQLNIHGVCHISNVTIQAPPFHNAIFVNRPDARVELELCHVYGEPALKYPAMFASGGTIIMRYGAVHQGKSSRAVFIEQSAELGAFDSSLGSVHVDGSKAFLTNARATSIVCQNRGRIEARGSLELSPDEDRRSLVIQGESACRVEWLRTPHGPWEGLCDESFLHIGGIEIPAGESYLVVKQGQGVVESESASVLVRGAGDAPGAAGPQDPKVVLWHARDARSFSTAVAPHLNPGDTVVLEEGEYFLEEYDNCLAIGVDITGKGRAEKTIVNGGLLVMEGCDVNVSNLTLRPAADRNALLMSAGNSVSMTNVIFESPEDAEFPAVCIGKGTATMTRCSVLAPADAETGRVDIGSGAHLDAADSNLGWLRVWGRSSAELSACSSMQVWAWDHSSVTSDNGHAFEPNNCSLRQVITGDGSAVHFGQVTTDAPYFEGFASASSLTMEWLGTPDDGTASILFEDNARVDVNGRQISFDDLDASTGEEDSPGEAPDQSASAEAPASGLPVPDPAPADEAVAGDPLTEIMSLTGLVKVKDQIQSFARMVQFNQMRQKQGLKATGFSMHSMFLGNPGTGKTTVARLLGKALFDADAIQRDVFIEAGRRDLVGEHLGASANMTQRVLESARGGVLFIDEAYSLYQKDNNAFGQEAVDTLLTYMENNRGDIVVIFAGYTDRMQDFLNMNPGLKSRVPNRFDFEDYTPAEVADIGYRSLLQDDYTVEESLYQRAVAGAYSRSTDKSNGRWVRNFNEDLVKQMARRVFSDQSSASFDLARITDEDIFNLIGGDSDQKGENTQILLEQLDSLVGLAPVKEWVRKLVNRVRVDQRRTELDGAVSRPTYHMVFAGNPGTGKTTVAKIIAQLFYNLGILEHAVVKEVDRSSLVGGWIGHTEENTSKAINEAMGGVLFVDEAYQLYLEGMPNDFGRQAIETFMTRLENDRDKFVAIFAGYTENMESFLSANPGLRSRIPLTIEFPDYTPEEVGEIAAAHLAKSWAFDRAAVVDAAAKAYAALDARDRSNGRWARTFAERIEAEHIEYVAARGLTGAEMNRIPPAVIEALLHA